MQSGAEKKRIRIKNNCMTSFNVTENWIVNFLSSLYIRKTVYSFL